MRARVEKVDVLGWNKSYPLISAIHTFCLACVGSLLLDGEFGIVSMT